MQTTPEIIIETINNNRSEVVALYRSVSITALVLPLLPNDWSIKDVIAHIAAWEWRCAGLLQAARETNGPLRASPDVDGLNREFYKARRHWSWDRVEADFRQAYSFLVEAIQQLPPERLQDRRVQQTIASDTWEHYAEHLPEMARCLSRTASMADW